MQLLILILIPIKSPLSHGCHAGSVIPKEIIMQLTVLI